jgi:hypothetical protein
MARVGRLLVTAAILGSGPVIAWADLSRTHVFNPRWTPHARFHDASAVVTELGWSIASLWLLWRRGTRDQRELALKIAALHPVLAYAPFLIAEALPGAGAEDEPGKIPRVAGVPANLFAAGVWSGLSALGYLLARGEDPLTVPWRADTSAPGEVRPGTRVRARGLEGRFRAAPVSLGFRCRGGGIPSRQDYVVRDGRRRSCLMRNRLRRVPGAIS